jgi:hypothetical protein
MIRYNTFMISINELEKADHLFVRWAILQALRHCRITNVFAPEEMISHNARASIKFSTAANHVAC